MIFNIFKKQKDNTKDKNVMRKCVKCKKEIPASSGVMLLRGASFSCKDCLEKHKLEKKDSNEHESCEFC